MGNHQPKPRGDNSNNHSKHKQKEDDKPPVFKTIKGWLTFMLLFIFSTNFLDSFESIELLQEALQKNGLESSNLILGIDYTVR